MRKTGLYLITIVYTIICMIYLTGCSSQMEKDIAGVEAPAPVTVETSDSATVKSPAPATGNSAVSTDNEKEPFQIDFFPNRTNLTEYQSRYEDETKRIKETKDGSFEKVEFEDCEFGSIQSVESVGIYRLYSEEMSAEESIETIQDWLKEIGCEEMDLETELRDASGQYERSSGQYPYDYPAVFDYYPAFDSGKGFFINTNQCYIQMGSDGIYSMSDGTITDFLNLDSLAAMDALGINEENIVDKGMVSQMGGGVWELTDGKMSISDAANMVKLYFEAGTPRQNPKGISVDIPEVEVFALNDKYGYSFAVRRVFNGLPFAYTGTGSRSYYSPDYEIVEDAKTAYVISHDNVAAYTGYAEAEQIKALIDVQTNIIGLIDAASLLNGFLAANVRLTVHQVSLVYCTCVEATGEKIVYPCWQFDGVNQTNNQSMRFYVNVLSGDIYYYSYVEG